MLYVISPIDLIPDFIPVIGFLDDAILAPLAIRWMLKRLPPHIMHAAATEPGSISKPARQPGPTSTGDQCPWPARLERPC